MKLQPDRIDALSIQAHGPGWVVVGGQRHETSVIVSTAGRLRSWDCRSHAELTAAHFDLLADDGPEVVIFGSGRRLRFVHPSLLRGLIERRIGVETMDTMAAARTYNILAGEGRRVVAALLIEAGDAI
ncbi:MAG: Mth938-like domain-containing protein [Tepidimonas sp.]|uniref:Mth938-like domain-containing protein n=1 Tax=Tepidimonas sp. TaxID=2002775 RepID=UPI004054EDCE